MGGEQDEYSAHPDPFWQSKIVIGVVGAVVGLIAGTSVLALVVATLR